jgi:hypothetical protein
MAAGPVVESYAPPGPASRSGTTEWMGPSDDSYWGPGPGPRRSSADWMGQGPSDDSYWGPGHGPRRESAAAMHMPAGDREEGGDVYAMHMPAGDRDDDDVADDDDVDVVELLRRFGYVEKLNPKP